MQQTIFMVIMIVVLLLAFFMLGLLILNARAKTKRQKILEQLVDEINDKRLERSNKILNCLTRHYQIDTLAAKEIAALLYSAEKQFLMQFVEKQMHDSVADFYDNLCDLLDNFLSAIPITAIHPVAEKEESAPETLSDKLDSDDEDMREIDIPADAEPPPDWGDVFD